MKREEAIEVLRRLPIGLMDLSCEQKSDLTEALNIALAALRGPTRERVEKYFGAVWEFDDEDMEYDWSCSKCAEMLNYRENFCSRCGSAMTDKAVEITLQRLEALHENDR